ncbi:[similarity to] coenzyme A disulfide reductase [methanotrophic bacterial endosymbiont of Bathymodiolus sp.]|nr:[similarity to] coenzyme A disulfide reductase [methanotrophic bacterial endosymbiont of Bathymodiolus sp.]
MGADGVDKRIDVIATAIYAGLKVDDLADLELAYAPPYGSAKDPVNMTGYVASNILDKTVEVVDWRDLRDDLNSSKSNLQLLDVRTAQEFEFGSISTARNIDVNHLRQQLGELDVQEPTVVFCQVGIRGIYRI